MKRALRVGLLFVLVGVLLFMGFGNEIIERFFVYFPERELAADPGAYGLAFENVYFQSSDGVKLHGWFVPGRGDVTWLWFHGNAGNISHRLDNVNLLHRALGANIFIIDYRGYGRSEGRPTEKGTYRDAEAALAYLLSRDDIKDNRIVYFGRSLGGAVAVELALRHEPYALILESAFDSVADMARRSLPYLPLWLALRGMYNSVGKIGKIGAPILVLHGDRDEVIPFEVGERLFDAAGEPKEFYAIQGAGHNDTYLVGSTDYLEALRRFAEGLEHR